jgi:hypothetical protein
MQMSLVKAIVGAQTGLMQLSLAADFARMKADQGASVAKLIDAAQKNVAPLANVAANIGTGLDVTA